MQLWVHTADTSVNNQVGFLNVTPDSVALALIAAGKAQDGRAGANSLIKSAGNVAWKGHQANVIGTEPPPLARSEASASGSYETKVMTAKKSKG